MPTATDPIALLSSALERPRASRDTRTLLRVRSCLEAFPALDYDEVSALAEDAPEAIKILLADIEDRTLVDAVRYLAAALFSVEVPGKTERAVLGRAFSPKFWRPRLWLRVLRAQELERLAAGKVGKHQPYASPQLIATRRAQLKQQAAWLAATTATATIDGKVVKVPLEKIVKTAEQRIARVYAFVAAIDRIAVENNLETALITTTLPGEWHANPNYKGKDWAWNGKSPKEGADELTRLFQLVRRDLDNRGVYLSGIWVGELHKDGTPHRHYWCVYRPEHAAVVRATFLKHFPGKLRLRGRAKRLDLAFLTPEDALAGRGVSLHKSPLKRSGFQVDVSIVDRERGSGASYCFKYLEKAMLQDALFEKEPALRAIDAARSLWKMRSYDFFGIQKCLGRWDELRRLHTAPTDPFLRELWMAARGGAVEGRIRPDPETGKPSQRGDAYKFLKLQGSLAALRTGRVSRPAVGEVRHELALEKERGTNYYEEETAKTIGVSHVEVRCVAVDLETGEVHNTPRRGKRFKRITLRTTVASELTRSHVWQLETVKQDRPNYFIRPAAVDAPPLPKGQLEFGGV